MDAGKNGVISNENVGKGWNLCRKLWLDQVFHRSFLPHSSSEQESPHNHPQYLLRPTINYHQNHSFQKANAANNNATRLHKSNGNLTRHHALMESGDDDPFIKMVTKALLRRRQLSFTPDKKLYFPYEPGKQATSAVRIKNVCRCPIAFKFQTTAPKSCFMRPPNGVLAPGESIVAIVVKHIHQRERAHGDQARDKFKILSMKIPQGLEYTPEIFDERKDLVTVEQILKVHFLDPKQPTPELEKLKQRIAEADAANEAGKKSMYEYKGPTKIVGEGDILEEWNKLKLARNVAKEEFE